MNESILKNQATGWRCAMLLLVLFGMVPSIRGADRVVRALDMTMSRGGTNCLSIVLESRGNENALGLSLCFDTNQLAFLSLRRGIAAGAAALNVNSNQVSRGRLGCALALPTGEQFPQGINPVLEVCFRAAAGAGVMTTPVMLCDLPLAREIVDVDARNLAASYSNANVTLVGTCHYGLDPASAASSSVGGTGVVTLAADIGCSWSVANTNSWIVFQSPTNGTGGTNLSYTVAANGAQSARTGVVRIADQSFTIIQAAPCNYSISPTSRMHTALSEFATVNVSAPAGCDWEIVNTNNWILIKLATNGSGAGLARYTVFANDRALTRSGVITIAGLPFTVTQFPAPCSFSMLQTNRLLGGGGETGVVTFATLEDCTWTAYNTNIWIEMPPTIGGVGGGRIAYAVGPNFSNNERSGSVTVGGLKYTITQLPADASSSLSPASRLADYQMSTGSVVVTIGTAGSNAVWRIYNTNAWISIPTGNIGTGRRTVPYTIAPLLEHSMRTGMLYIADRIFTVTQSGPPCIYTFSPTNRAHTYISETSSVPMATDGPCGWGARSDSPWLVLDSPTNGTGSAVLDYHVTLNTGPARTGRLSVSNQSFVITQGAATPVSFTRQPTNQFVVIGQSASFSAVVTGTPPLVCQWQLNGTNLMDGPNIAGTTTTNLSLANVQPGQSGNYALIVSNIRGSATSSPPAVLRVNTPPTLAPLADRCVVRGVPVTFTATAVDTDVPAQKLTYSLDAGAPSGAAINASSGAFSWTASTGFGASTYPITVRVVDNGVPSLTNSRTFSITVAPGNITNLALVVTPGNGAVLPVGDPLLLSMPAPDTNGTVARVDYYLDANAIGSATSPPFALPLEAAAPGLHTVAVRAVDVCGTATTSAPNYFLVAPQGAQVLFHPGFSNPPPGLWMSGMSAVLSNELFLTRPINNQGAAVWQQRKAFLTDGFEARFLFRTAVPAGNAGGEGFAFVLQNSTPTPLGSGGAGLGYAGISNSLAIEFDTQLSAALGDPNDNHISIHTLGLLTNSANEGASIGQAPAPNLADGRVHLARIDYVANRLRVFLDDLSEPVITVATNLSSILNLENGRAWVGFTAATSAAMESHEILAWSLVATNQPPSVTLASPADGTTFISPATLPLMADGSDPDDRIARVDFFLGSNLLGSSAGPLFGMQWSNVPPGDYTLTARATDTLGLVATSAAVRVTVVFVNKPPTFTPGPDQTVLEDSGPRTVPGWASAISPGPPDEASEVLTFVVTNDNASLFTAQPRIDAGGTLTFTPAADAFGLATVTVLLRDDGGTANGGHDTSVPQTFVIHVVPVNDQPSFARGPDQTVLEDAGAQTVAGWATQIRAGPSNEFNQILNFSVTTDNPTLFAVPPRVAPDGTLSYTAAAEMNGVATVRIVLRDDGGIENRGVSISVLQSFTLTVVPVNDPPAFTPGTDVVVLEDAGPLIVTNWATNLSSGPPNEESQALSFVVTNDAPGLFSSPPAIDPQGTLSFRSAPDAFGVAVVTVVLRDNGGTVNGGFNSSAPQWFAIRIGSVNDAPSFEKGPNQFGRDNAGPLTVPNWATQIRAGPLNESTQSIRFELTIDNPGLFEVQPFLAPDGTLTYTPMLDRFGVANIQVVLRDNGGTADGGNDTSAAQSFRISVVTNLPPLVTLTNPTNDAVFISPATIVLLGDATDLDGSVARVEFLLGTNVLASVTSPPYSMDWRNVPPGDYVLTARATDNRGLAATTEPANIQVLFVNKPPSFTPGADQTVLEDSGSKTVGGWASALSPGPPDENWETLTFLVTNSTPGIFEIQPAIDPRGTLTFTPASDAFGTSTVTVVLRDNGGTANGGQDSSATVTFNIRILSVNDAPSMVPGPDQTVLEDSGMQTVPGWATQLRAGPANEASQSISISLTTDNPGLFESQPFLSANGTLTYAPVADKHGVATIHMTLRDDGGTANGGHDTNSFPPLTISVLPVNDPPSFTSGPDVTVLEDAGLQTIHNWASNLSRGPASESGQMLTFTISNNAPELFAIQPAIDPGGTLTFASVPDAFGQATVTVVLRDDGGTANGGRDRSPSRTFVIRVLPVNDPPVFTKGSNLIVAEDAGAQVVPGWAGQIRSGPVNETGQRVAFGVTTDNPGLFAAPPAVAPDGTLTFAGAPEIHGLANVRVALHDDGGTNNGGFDAQVQFFTITVVPVNDPPSFTPGTNVVVLEDAGLQLLTHWATEIRPGPANESTQQLHFELVAIDNPGLFSEVPSIETNGTLRFRTAPDAVGTSQVSFVVKDDGGKDDGGQDSSAPATLTFTVVPVNDAPSFDRGPDLSVLDIAGPQTIPDWARNFSVGPLDESSQRLSILVQNDNVALFASPPAIDLSGTLTFEPIPDVIGSALVTVVLQDDGGKENGGRDASNPVTFRITVQLSNRAPMADAGATATRFISPNNTNAAVVLDGSRSWDPENDPLTFAGYESGASLPFAFGMRTTNWLQVGVHPITMLLNDGRHTVTEQIVIDVFRACEAVDEVIVLVESASLERKNRRPLIATLKAACASFDRGSFNSGANQLKAFQNKVLAQIALANPESAAEWSRRVQEIIDAVGEKQRSQATEIPSRRDE